jgi:Sec-independent protein translocase protein TatA
MPDMLFILLLAVVVLGPKRLPAFARQLGRYRAKLNQMQREFSAQIQAEVDKVRQTEDDHIGA